MRLLGKRQVKTIKLFLLSPILERLLLVIHLVVLPMILHGVLENDGQISNYDLNQFFKEKFYENKLSQVQNKEEFATLVTQIVRETYKIDSKPFLIPLGKFRISKYLSGICAPEIQCDAEKFDCVTQYFTSMLDTKCTDRVFSEEIPENLSIWSFLIPKFRGKVSEYDLNGGLRLDFNLDDLVADENLVSAFLEDDFEYSSLTFNIYCPYLKTYHKIYLGLERMNYLVPFNSIFSSNSYSNIRNNFYIFTLTMILLASSGTAILKIIYEFNLKKRLFVHLFTGFYHLLVVLLNIALLIGYGQSDEGTVVDQVKKTEYINNLVLVYMRKYVIAILTVIFVLYPFRVISFFSWFRSSSYITNYLNTLFRMLPGILVVSFFIVSLSVSFSTVLYAVFNEYILQFSNYFSSIINIMCVFDVSLTSQVDLDKTLSSSNYFKIYFFLFSLFFLILFFAAIGTFSYLFHKTKEHETDESEDSPMLKEIRELKEYYKLNEDESTLGDEALPNRQVFWLSLDEKNKKYTELSKKIQEERPEIAGKKEEINLVLLSSSAHIISFFKLLFAVKPILQFQNLEERFVVIVDASSGRGPETRMRFDSHRKMDEGKLKEILELFDWLTFTGAKVPVWIYTDFVLEKSAHMKIESSYFRVNFANTDEQVDRIVKGFSRDPLRLDKVNSVKTFLRQQSGRTMSRKDPGTPRSNPAATSHRNGAKSKTVSKKRIMRNNTNSSFHHYKDEDYKGSISRIKEESNLDSEYDEDDEN